MLDWLQLSYSLAAKGQIDVAGTVWSSKNTLSSGIFTLWFLLVPAGHCLIGEEACQFGMQSPVAAEMEKSLPWLHPHEPGVAGSARPPVSWYWEGWVLYGEPAYGEDPTEQGVSGSARPLVLCILGRTSVVHREPRHGEQTTEPCIWFSSPPSKI